MTTAKVTGTLATELAFQVLVDPNITEAPEGSFLYEENLGSFYHMLISGSPLPLTLVIRSLEDVTTLLAIALFLHRDLSIHPSMPGLVTAFNLVCDEPFWGPAHIDRDLARFLRHLQQYVSQTGLDKRQQGECVASSVQWIREYVHLGNLPQMAPEPPPPSVLLTGSDGFVLAKTEKNLPLGWVELFRQGHLKGILIGPSVNDRRPVTIARKSPAVTFGLDRLQAALEAVEDALGEISSWSLTEDTLSTPGTLMTLQHLLQLATHT